MFNVSVQQKEDRMSLTKNYVLISSVVAVGLAIGCSRPTTPDQSKSASPSSTSGADSAEESDDHHHGAGPHGGTVAEWGDGNYHVEFTVDHGKKESVVYILGSDGTSPAPVKTDKVLLSINEPAFQVELLPQPMDGETEGMSSRFVGAHDNLGIVREFAGTISAEADGTPFAGEFAETAEGHVH
jgi:hypothetical protein